MNSFERSIEQMRHSTVGRLALRIEGDNWCAYYARPNTMEEAILLGSIRISLVARQPERKSAFMALMKSAVGDIIEDFTGHRPEWKEAVAAPEHERSGSA